MHFHNLVNEIVWQNIHVMIGSLESLLILRKLKKVNRSKKWKTN